MRWTLLLSSVRITVEFHKYHGEQIVCGGWIPRGEVTINIEEQHLGSAVRHDGRQPRWEKDKKLTVAQ